MRFGFGVYFGRSRRARRGELLLVYDHRHDGFAGGMKIGGLGSGRRRQRGSGGARDVHAPLGARHAN